MFKTKVIFYMMRHGFCVPDKAGFNVLTKEGEEGVKRSARNNLMGIEFVKAYSSPEIRALKTMAIILDVTDNDVRKSDQLDVKCPKGLSDDGDSLAEIKNIARKIALSTAPSNSDERNVIIVTHSSNILACSGACPTMPEPNYADIVRLEVEVTDSSTRIVSTQRIPRGF